MRQESAIVYEKLFMMFTLLAAAFCGVAHADDAAIRQSLAKLGVQSTEIRTASGRTKPSPHHSGVLYVTGDGKTYYSRADVT